MKYIAKMVKFSTDKNQSLFPVIKQNIKYHANVQKMYQATDTGIPVAKEWEIIFWIMISILLSFTFLRISLSSILHLSIATVFRQKWYLYYVQNLLSFAEVSTCCFSELPCHFLCPSFPIGPRECIWWYPQWSSLFTNIFRIRIWKWTR